MNSKRHNSHKTNFLLPNATRFDLRVSENYTVIPLLVTVKSQIHVSGTQENVAVQPRIIVKREKC